MTVHRYQVMEVQPEYYLCIQIGSLMQLYKILTFNAYRQPTTAYLANTQKRPSLNPVEMYRSYITFSNTEHGAHSLMTLLTFFSGQAPLLLAVLLSTISTLLPVITLFQA